MESVLVVSIREDGATDQELEVIGDLLRDELLGLEVGPIRRMSEGAAPPGTRGVDIAALGGLLVSLPATPPILEAVIGVVRDWLKRPRQDRGVRSVHIEIDGDVLELSQVSADEQGRLIEDWLQRRGSRRPEAGNGDGSP